MTYQLRQQVLTVTDGTSSVSTRFQTIRMTYNNLSSWRQDTIADSQGSSIAWQSWDGETLKVFTGDASGTVTQIHEDQRILAPPGEWFQPVASVAILLGEGWAWSSEGETLERARTVQLECTRVAVECVGASETTIVEEIHEVREAHGLPTRFTASVGDRVISSMEVSELRIADGTATTPGFNSSYVRARGPDPNPDPDWMQGFWRARTQQGGAKDGQEGFTEEQIGVAPINGGDQLVTNLGAPSRPHRNLVDLNELATRSKA